MRDRVCILCGLFTPDHARATGHATMCACLDPGYDHTRVWAVDPGDKHVGVSAGLVDRDEVRVLQTWTHTPDSWIETFTGVLNQKQADLVVCEEFRLYAWKAREQGFSNFPTVELIGVIKYLCRLHGVPLVLQGASTKDMSIKVARAYGVPLTKLRSGREDFPGRNQHERDSSAHLYWWAFRNESSPIVLAEKEQQRAGQPRKRP